MILSLVAFSLFAFGALAGWRAMLFPVYVLSPVLLATFVFLPWLTVGLSFATYTRGLASPVSTDALAG